MSPTPPDRPRFITADPMSVPYSERKAMQPSIERLPIEIMTRIQNLACEGLGPDEIVAKTGAPLETVARICGHDGEPVRRLDGFRRRAPNAPPPGSLWSNDPAPRPRRQFVDVAAARACYGPAMAGARKFWK
jgi:hypothetical protein